MNKTLLMETCAFTRWRKTPSTGELAPIPWRMTVHTVTNTHEKGFSVNSTINEYNKNKKCRIKCIKLCVKAIFILKTRLKSLILEFF